MWLFKPFYLRKKKKDTETEREKKKTKTKISWSHQFHFGFLVFSHCLKRSQNKTHVGKPRVSGPPQAAVQGHPGATRGWVPGLASLRQPPSTTSTTVPGLRGSGPLGLRAHIVQPTSRNADTLLTRHSPVHHRHEHPHPTSPPK